MALITQINELPDQCDLLVRESLREKFNFLQKMQCEWNSGKNAFSKEGEIVFGAFHENLVIGICGLNIDPYTEDKTVGRLRHLYVSSLHRRSGLGSQLVKNCIECGLKTFRTIRLRAANSKTDRFYQDIGFSKVDEDSASHVIRINQNRL